MAFPLSFIAGLTLATLATMSALRAADPGAPTPLESGRAASFEESRIWTHGEDGAVWHHVYGLTVSKTGTLLAFSEARVGKLDEDPHHLVCKRSVDGGRTWSASLMLERGDGSFWDRNGQPGRKECWTNAAALADLHTGRVFFFYALSEGMVRERNTQRMTRVFYRATDDDGRTWSERVEITHVLNVKADGSPNLDADGRPVLNADGFPCDHLGRAFHMPGPGHGIQLRVAKAGRVGRLLVQVWHRLPIGNVAPDGAFTLTRIADRRYAVSVIASDDHGKTWTSGGFTGDGQPISESRLVEMADGRVMINARIDQPGEFRADAFGGQGWHVPASSPRWIAISGDGGTTWADGRIDAALPASYPTDSGLVVYARRPEAVRDCWLSSHPHDPAKRQRMTVRASFDEGATWPVHKVIHPGAGSYSDLVVLPDRTIGMLFQKTAIDRKTKRGSNHVVFARFNYEWLAHGE